MTDRVRAAAAILLVTLAAGPLIAQQAPDVGSQPPLMAAPETPAAPGVDPLPGASASEPADVSVDARAVPPPAPVASRLPAETPEAFRAAAARTERFLRDGGPAIWVIAALSVATVALILWKVWRFFLAGAWSRRASRRAIALWEAGRHDAALDLVSSRRGLRSRMTAAAMQARRALPDDTAREEAARVAKGLLGRQHSGLRALELIATIAPLLGLLGTVLGMIAAFQALQQAGSRADPALLAGGIWEALLTTAAGMAVAIPASAALTWFEAVIENLRRDMEDLAARIFIAPLERAEDARTGLAAQ